MIEQQDILPVGFPRSKIAYFVTSNFHKFQEVRMILSRYNISTAMLRIGAVEIQDDTLENIAKYSVQDAVKNCGLPIFVEDAGLFVEALGGFPGPYSKYVYKKIGSKGVLKLMDNVQNRRAHFQSVIAFSSPNSKPVWFSGLVKGKLTLQERGISGFGYDPIFEPEEGNGRTFAEMTILEKNSISHRAKAIIEFAEWIASQNKRIF
ncbi:MAG: XTP/dITP diphosphatase [Candidatus Bathyarchaeota archaeon]